MRIFVVIIVSRFPLESKLNSYFAYIFTFVGTCGTCFPHFEIFINHVLDYSRIINSTNCVEVNNERYKYYPQVILKFNEMIDCLIDWLIQIILYIFRTYYALSFESRWIIHRYDIQYRMTFRVGVKINYICFYVF